MFNIITQYAAKAKSQTVGILDKDIVGYHASLLQDCTGIKSFITLWPVL
jgi:hypothetical protein